jgi:hypothetical protein
MREDKVILGEEEKEKEAEQKEGKIFLREIYKFLKKRRRRRKRRRSKLSFLYTK